MSLRGWMLLATIAMAVGWWYSDASPRVPEPARLANGLAAAGCERPPRVAYGQAPLQTPVPATMLPIALADAMLVPLAGFSLEARVLSRQNYHFGRESRLAPTDLALGWQDMEREEVLKRLSITQSGRWYQYRWAGPPPLPPALIVRQSANMHLIPASGAVAQTLAAVRPHQRVRIDGWLVEAKMGKATWRSSTTREDTGDGACELIYVCALSVIP